MNAYLVEHDANHGGAFQTSRLSDAVLDEVQLGSLPAMIAMTRAYNAQVQGNLSATVKYAELALQHIPEDDLFRRTQATVLL